MRWTNQVNERSRIVYEGRTYQIIPETFHSDRQDNTIQFLAQVIINDKTPAPPTPAPEPTPTPTPEPDSTTTH